ncbi:MAG: proton-conducting transporter membrane subunit [Alphaproteobacteria bacterium]
MNPSLLPLLIVVATLVSGIVIFLTPDRMVRFRTALNVAGALITLAFVVILVFGVLQGGNYATRMPLLPGAPLLLQSDALSLLFAGLSAVLWLVTTVYAVGYLRRGPHRPRFFGFFALCVSATMGVALAGNLLTFLVFYEMLTLSTYPLVTHRGDAASLRAGRIYLAYTLTGGALLLLGTMLLYALQGSGDFIVGGLLSGAEDRPSAGVLGLLFLILIAGVGVKAALVPLHGWLPVAMVAPAPVSALLHAVAVVKAGVFGIVRIVYDIFGEPLVEALNLLMPLAAVAGATILYGSIRALGQDDLKRRLAFSTVSQVSYIALGVSLAHPVAALGGIIHLVHQGIMKITLFFCAGAVSETTGIKKISGMNGLGRRMPWTMGAFTIAAVGMIGLPPTAGFVTKWYVSSGGLETGATWVMVLMLISSGLNAAYFLPVMQRVWFLAPPPQQAGHPGRSKASLLLVGPPLVTAALTVAAALFADSPFSPLGWTEALVLREFGFAGTSPDEARVPGNPLLLLSLAPLAVTVFAVLGLGRAVWPLFALAAVPAAVTAAFMPGDAAGGEIPALRLDPDFAPFLLAAALIWAAAAIHSRQSVGGAANARRYAIFFGLAMTGNIGLVIADNMVAFYVGFSVMSLAVYGLVAHKGTAETDRASRIYMWLAVAGELTLFAAILLISSAQDGTLPPRLTGAAPSGAAAWLVLIGCGIKAGLVPLHVWLSLAHPVAPVPASAALSGAMLKAGIIGMLLLVPPELGTPEGFGEIMILTGLAGAFGGAVYGTMQRDLKTALAYSSLSQMGLALTALGAAYAGLAQAGAAAAALALFAIHHGPAKGAAGGDRSRIAPSSNASTRAAGRCAGSRGTRRKNGNSAAPGNFPACRSCGSVWRYCRRGAGSGIESAAQEPPHRTAGTVDGRHRRACRRPACRRPGRHVLTDHEMHKDRCQLGSGPAIMPNTIRSPLFFLRQYHIRRPATKDTLSVSSPSARAKAAVSPTFQFQDTPI